jgi:hypothetical protein
VLVCWCSYPAAGLGATYPPAELAWSSAVVVGNPRLAWSFTVVVGNPTNRDLGFCSLAAVGVVCYLRESPPRQWSASVRGKNEKSEKRGTTQRTGPPSLPCSFLPLKSPLRRCVGTNRPTSLLKGEGRGVGYGG